MKTQRGFKGGLGLGFAPNQLASGTTNLSEASFQWVQANSITQFIGLHPYFGTALADVAQLPSSFKHVHTALPFAQDSN